MGGMGYLQMMMVKHQLELQKTKRVAFIDPKSDWPVGWYVGKLGQGKKMTPDK